MIYCQRGVFVLQVGYGVPAVLVALIGLKPQVTGREKIWKSEATVSVFIKNKRKTVNDHELGHFLQHLQFSCFPLTLPTLLNSAPADFPRVDSAIKWPRHDFAAQWGSSTETAEQTHLSICPYVYFFFSFFSVCIAETLPWRRVADLHVMISSAVIAMLGWALYKERVTQIFHQEEGRCGFLLNYLHERLSGSR